MSESVAIFDPARLKEIAAELSWTPKAKGKHLSAYRLHTHFEVLSGKAARIDATSASPKGDADERAVLQRTIEADRCSILDRGYISYQFWNAINSAGSRYVCRSSDRTAATVMQVDELTDVDRAAGVVSDGLVDLGWKSRHRIRPDHPLRLICVAVKPHAGCGNMRGPTCDGVLRIVTNRLDLPAALIAEMVRLRWVIEIFFRTFKQLLGCRHLFSCDHNGVEIQAYCGMIVCMLILLYTGEKPNRAMHQMVWYYLIGLASLKELEAIIKSWK